MHSGNIINTIVAYNCSRSYSDASQLPVGKSRRSGFHYPRIMEQTLEIVSEDFIVFGFYRPGLDERHIDPALDQRQMRVCMCVCVCIRLLLCDNAVQFVFTSMIFFALLCWAGWAAI